MRKIGSMTLGKISYGILSSFLTSQAHFQISTTSTFNSICFPFTFQAPNLSSSNPGPRLPTYHLSISGPKLVVSTLGVPESRLPSTPIANSLFGAPGFGHKKARSKHLELAQQVIIHALKLPQSESVMQSFSCAQGVSARQYPIPSTEGWHKQLRSAEQAVLVEHEIGFKQVEMTGETGWIVS